MRSLRSHLSDSSLPVKCTVAFLPDEEDNREDVEDDPEAAHTEHEESLHNILQTH